MVNFGNKKQFIGFFRIFTLVCYYNYFCDELTQVHGTVYMIDITGHTMANEMKVSLEEKKKFTVIMQVSGVFARLVTHVKLVRCKVCKMHVFGGVLRCV
jgi:hypothetical protein